MVGLMTIWFGPFVDMRPDFGYFHLCPSCYRQRIKPHLEQVQGRLLDLHPLARQLGLHGYQAEELDADADAQDAATPQRPPAGPEHASVAAGPSRTMIEDRPARPRRSPPRP
jgi:hypothetical protein